MNYLLDIAEDCIRHVHVTGVQTCALPISSPRPPQTRRRGRSKRSCQLPPGRRTDAVVPPGRSPAPRWCSSQIGSESCPGRTYTLGDDVSTTCTSVTLCLLYTG